MTRMLAGALAVVLGLIGAPSISVGEERLPGKDVSLESAVRRASEIVVAEIVELSPGPSKRGYTAYSDVKLKVSRSLKGEPGQRDRTLYSLPVRDRAAEADREMVPKAGEHFIIFIEPLDKRGLLGFKLLRSTEENRTAVSNAVRQAEPKP